MSFYKFFFRLMVAAGITMHAQDFLYPVAPYTDHTGTTKLYLIYQKSLTHLELWLWDPQTKCAVKALLSSFTPAGLTMLPNNVGFSFIDDGRIRVKKYKRRLPKAFDIREPLYDIGVMQWIDENCGYFSAKERGHYGIFQLTMHDELDRIIVEQDVDCMYPSKKGEELFYVERALVGQRYHYKIMKISYPCIRHMQESSFNADIDCKDRLEDILREEALYDMPTSRASVETKQCVYDFGDCPIAFLTMITENQGYVIEHPATIDKHDNVITFTCHFLNKVDDAWQRRALFTFSVPSYLLISNNDSCLYESLLPLLPRYYNDSLYFADSPGHANNRLALFSYNLLSGVMEQKSEKLLAPSLIFFPVACGNQFFYGGALNLDEPIPAELSSADAGSEMKNSHMPMLTMSIYEDGNVMIYLPSFDV